MAIKESVLGFFLGASRAFSLEPDDDLIDPLTGRLRPALRRDPDEDATNLAGDWHRVASALSSAWDLELRKRDA